MEVSFILSSDELYTLILLSGEMTEAGQQFCDKTLHDAQANDLSGLIEKNLAKKVEDELELEPVLRMISSAISQADNTELNNGVWSIRSPWVDLRCEKYQFNENHWKITPVNTGTAYLK